MSEKIERVRVETLRVGDVVFDIFAGEHRVTFVRVTKHSVVFKRDDGQREVWPRDVELTIRRESES